MRRGAPDAAADGPAVPAGVVAVLDAGVEADVDASSDSAGTLTE